MRKLYPKPKPYQVLGITASDWNYPGRGRPVPTMEQFTSYMVEQGQEVTPAEYEAWRGKVEAAKLANAPDEVKDGTPTTEAASTTSAKPATPATPATPLAVLPHQRAKPEAVPMEVMSVRVRVGINARLDMYRARVRASKQEIVSDVLDAFLTGQGF